PLVFLSRRRGQLKSPLRITSAASVLYKKQAITISFKFNATQIASSHKPTFYAFSKLTTRRPSALTSVTESSSFNIATLSPYNKV
ncbi:hypothetical protein, partial [Streptococcus pluranimalium]